jgi:hypothetical protein
VRPSLPARTETDATTIGPRASAPGSPARLSGSRAHPTEIAVVVVDAPDIEAAMGALATSDEPFDKWFREHVRDVHGMDLAEGFPPPEQVLDYHA